MRVRFAVTLSVLLALALLAASGAVILRRQVRPLLDAVSTVEELRAARPIALKTGERVRLGLSATSVGVGEPLVVYALVEGEKEPEHRTLGHKHPRPEPARRGEPLGPLIVRTRSTKKLEHLARFLQRKIAGPDRLYMTALTFETPGVAEIVLETKDGAEVLRGEVAVTPVGAASFLELDATETVEDDDHVVCECGVNRLSLTDLDLPGDRAFETPRVFLPRPFEEPVLALAVDGGELVVTSRTKDLDATPVWEQFAARWWVNGVPVIARSHALVDRESSGRVVETNQVRFRLHLDRGVLGARSGDRISVQLLYRGDELPRLTNRVDFTLP